MLGEQFSWEKGDGGKVACSSYNSLAFSLKAKREKNAHNKKSFLTARPSSIGLCENSTPNFCTQEIKSQFPRKDVAVDNY